MFDHVEIRVADLEASGAFYRLALGAPGHESEKVTEWGDFDIAQASAERPVTQRLHIGFAAHSREEVDALWERLTGAGYASDGEPGVRPEYNETYYGAFLLDPDGNSVESVHHHATDPEVSLVDHLWLRTPSVEAAKRFYELVAPVVGIRLVHDTPERVRFTDGVGSVFLVRARGRADGARSPRVRRRWPCGSRGVPPSRDLGRLRGQR